MALNWQNLEPHRPVAPGDPLYVERPTSASAGLLARLQQGARVVLVAGPAGIGKSTELGHVADQMRETTWPCLVQFDRVGNMRTFTEDLAVLTLLRQVTSDAKLDLGLTILSTGGKHWDKLLSRVRQIASTTGREVLFLLDGLEKAPLEVARPLFDLLGELSEAARLVVVVPWFATYGPMSQAVIHESEKVAHLRPVTVPGGPADSGLRFFRLLLAKRLALSESVGADAIEILDSAAKLSGGVPRTFLQLLADAGSRARYARDADWPDADDLREAAEDMVDSFRRLLQQGDTEALWRAEGTSGTEMDLPRKLRLLNHGILLEYEEDREVKMRMHPLVLPLVRKG